MTSFVQRHATITPELAQEQGYTSITTSYNSTEEVILQRAIKDQEGTDFHVVEVFGNCVEIWRKQIQLKKV